MVGISLFASGGIGDLAVREAGIEVIVANELLKERAHLFSSNYPECKMIDGDIWEKKEEIISETKRLLNGQSLDFMLATPPCQGMSKNGRGKLLSLYRQGSKPKFDKRNELIIPTIEIAKALNVETLIMENVPEMQNTVIPVNNTLMLILDFIKSELGNEYTCDCKVIEFANYGVPQRRQRLISIFTKNQALKTYYKENGTLFPPETHSKEGTKGLNKWITLRECLDGIPPLDAKTKITSIDKKIPFHKVPILDAEKYLWVSNTPLEKSAFDNQCINPDCNFQMNPTHKSSINEQGINQASTETPLFCSKCSSLLPRPWVKEGNEYRIMKGYTSAYKRMSWDLPANTLTQNLSYACSDSKVHPEENRVLSLYEAMKIHTITNFDYKWDRNDGKLVSDKLIREIIGESVPPFGFYKIIQHIKNIMTKNVPEMKNVSQPKQISRATLF